MTEETDGQTSDLGVSTSAEGSAGNTSHASLVSETGEVVDTLYCFPSLVKCQ